jgi:hypothetical protein
MGGSILFHPDFVDVQTVCGVRKICHAPLPLAAESSACGPDVRQFPVPTEVSLQAVKEWGHGVKLLQFPTTQIELPFSPGNDLLNCAEIHYVPGV